MRLARISASQPFGLVSRIGEKKTPPALFTRIVGEPSSADGPGERHVDLVLLADVGDAGQPAGLGGGRLARRGVALPDRHPSAEGGEPVGDAPPDAGARAGDDRDPPVQRRRPPIQDHGERP